MPAKKNQKRLRLNMRVHEELVVFGKAYAKEKNTSLTQIIVDYLTKLQEKSNGKQAGQSR
jgi:hypothetical protein